MIGMVPFEDRLFIYIAYLNKKKYTTISNKQFQQLQQLVLSHLVPA